jgi:hypothetical protein
MPVADYLGRFVGWVEARSARRSVRGGKTSRRAESGNSRICQDVTVRDPRTPYLSATPGFGVACSLSVVEDGGAAGASGGRVVGPWAL